MATKLSKIGNSFSVRIPKEKLSKAGFKHGDELEIIEKNGVLLILKKIPHHSQWKFEGDTSLSEEDKLWLNADLGRIND
jgi:antitoxin component of MazEF toxin-antitoxin module